MFINLIWGAALATMYMTLRDYARTQDILIRNYAESQDGDLPALIWLMEQLGQHEAVEQHDLNDPWWSTRPPDTIEVEIPPAQQAVPALQWLLLKMGQEQALYDHNVTDAWWLHRPQQNITLNATNVTVGPMPSAKNPEPLQSRRLQETAEKDETRLLVEGNVRVTQYVEYFSVPNQRFVKLIVAPESLRFLLKIMGMTEAPWHDDIYWAERNNATDVNITNTLNLNHINVAAVVANDLIIDGASNFYGSVDFWPTEEQPEHSERRLFSEYKDSCTRCAEFWHGDRCEEKCKPHTQVLGGRMTFDNRTCQC